MREEKARTEKGKKEGLEEGAEREAIQMAKGMKKEGIDIKIIAKLSGLSPAQIKKL